MKKIILIALILFISYPISAQELEDISTETGKPVTLERKVPKGEEQPPKTEEQPPKTEEKSLNPEEKTKNPPEQKELIPKTNKAKSNKPKYLGLTIYDKPENKPCGNCYYYYKKKFDKTGKYRKNIYYNRKAMTKEEKKEQEEKIKNLPKGFKIKKDKMKKICK